MSEKLPLSQFLESTDIGYLREHERLTGELMKLVGDESFEKLAKLKKQDDWRELAHQACEDVAGHYILVAEDFPTKEQARAKVLEEYKGFLKSPQQAAVSAAGRIH